MKVFDTVPNARLLRVLIFGNTPENLVKWVDDFFSERKQRVAVNAFQNGMTELAAYLKDLSLVLCFSLHT